MTTHDDPRRTLYDWAEGDFKSCKVVIVKEEIAIGDHYHLKKEEQFFLISGMFKELNLGDRVLLDVKAPYKVIVPPGLYHKFICTPGSIIVGVATEVFDPNDEIRK